jgi:hypothetical protein
VPGLLFTAITESMLTDEAELAAALTGDTNFIFRVEKRVRRLSFCGLDSSEGRTRMDEMHLAARQSAWRFVPADVADTAKCVACDMPKHCSFEVWEGEVMRGYIGRVCKQKYLALEGWHRQFRLSSMAVKTEMGRMRHAMREMEYANLK